MTVLAQTPPTSSTASASRSTESAAQGRAQAMRQAQGHAQGQGGAGAASGGFAQFLLAQTQASDEPAGMALEGGTDAALNAAADAEDSTQTESPEDEGRRRTAAEDGRDTPSDPLSPPPWMAELAPSRLLARRGGAAGGRSETSELQALGQGGKGAERPGAAGRGEGELGTSAGQMEAARLLATSPDTGLSPAQAARASAADAATDPAADPARTEATPAAASPDPSLLASAPPAPVVDNVSSPGAPGLSATDAPAATPHQAELTHAPGSAAFNDALGGQLQAWLDEGIQHAQLNLNPAELGPIDVRIALGEGGAHIELDARVASTLEALQQAMPALQQALGEAGVALAGAGLGQGSQQPAPDGSRDLSHLVRQLARGAGGAEGQGMPEAAASGRPVATDTRRLLDLYA